jgi:hypothetical protein
MMAALVVRVGLARAGGGARALVAAAAFVGARRALATTAEPSKFTMNKRSPTTEKTPGAVKFTFPVTHPHAHPHARTRTRTHTHKHTHIPRQQNSRRSTHIQTHTYTRVRAHTRTCTHTHSARLPGQTEFVLHKLEGGPANAAWATKEELLDLYYHMATVRRMETVADSLYKGPRHRAFVVLLGCIVLSPGASHVWARRTQPS